MAGTSCLSQSSQSDDHHTGRKVDQNRDQVHHTKGRITTVSAQYARTREGVGLLCTQPRLSGAIRAYTGGRRPLHQQLNNRVTPADDASSNVRTVLAHGRPLPGSGRYPTIYLVAWKLCGILNRAVEKQSKFIKLARRDGLCRCLKRVADLRKGATQPRNFASP